MALSYPEHVKERLRSWRDDDPSLYDAAARTLREIGAAPSSTGIDGRPHFGRLVTFTVPGRGTEYVVTWEPIGPIAAILSVSSAAELQQLARLKRD